MSREVYNLEPYKYIHVLDTSTNITRLECGPQKFVKKDHEQIVVNVKDFIKLKPRHYCVIKNPVILDEKRQIVYDEHDAAKVRFSEIEIRSQEYYPDPFPLYPFEELEQVQQPYKTVNQNCALLIRAVRPFTDAKLKTDRFIYDEYLFYGPATYKPRVEEEVVQEIKATVIKQNQALLVRAKKELVDYNKQKRRAGESWLVRQQGSYMPHVFEEIVELRKAFVLTDKRCIHLRAKKDLTDVYGKKRQAGEEWLVGSEHAQTHILDSKEKFVNEVKIISLSNRQYCYILNPVEEGKNQLGKKVLVKGEKRFFLQPGEELENNKIYDVIVLGEDEALLLKAKSFFKDSEGNEHKPGSTWMHTGPCDYIPLIEVEVIEQRKSYPLDKNEGIYVRDKYSGEVKMITGQTYMLSEYEELWQKQLSNVTEKLISHSVPSMDVKALIQTQPKKRDKTRTVTFKATEGSAVQLYDYKHDKVRIVFGPELIMLQPYEEISIIFLSGSFPIVENQIRSLQIELGPSQIKDQIIVETVDHAKLILDVSYNWEFRVDKKHKEDSNKIFQNKDYVGNACKAMSSRIRGIISGKTFDDFHKNSHHIIKGAALKHDKDGNIIPFKFNNNFFITDINSSGYTPVDKETEESLQRSFKIALDIQTKSKEAEAKHQQLQLQQEGYGQLERQTIQSDINSAIVMKKYLETQAETAIVRKQGVALAEARAKAEAKKIQGEAQVSQAENRVKAKQIQRKAELELLKQRIETEIGHQEALDELEIKTQKELAEIEAQKFKETIEAIGKDTIVQMAKAGPEMQAKLLKGLGLNGFMVVDGKNPINLMNTANGLIGGVSEDGNFLGTN